MSYTRKNRRGGSRLTSEQGGGGLFNFFTGRKAAPTVATPIISNLKAKRNYNLAHSKSRVANYLSKPGTVTYTNKERIRSEYQKAVDELRKIEKPTQTASALGSIAAQLKEGLKSPKARETGAVVITIPVGVAQLAYKAMMVFIAALVFVFWDIPTMGTIPMSAYLLPNAQFNTTRNAYGEARKYTGANKGNSNNIGIVENF